MVSLETVSYRRARIQLDTAPGGRFRHIDYGSLQGRPRKALEKNTQYSIVCPFLLDLRAATAKNPSLGRPGSSERNAPRKEKQAEIIRACKIDIQTYLNRGEGLKFYRAGPGFG